MDADTTPGTDDRRVLRLRRAAADRSCRAGARRPSWRCTPVRRSPASTTRPGSLPIWCENVFIVGALDLARSGGRLAPDADELALPGSVPVLRLSHGKMTVTSDADTPDRAAELMAAEILSSGDPLRVGVAIADRSSTRVAATLRYLLESSSADLELIDYRVGPSVGAHTGPGTAGAVYHSR